MKSKNLMWLFVFVLCVAQALAVQPNPEIYWGYVYLDGQLAPNGTLLVVESDSGESLAVQTLPINPSFPGSYSIEVPFDNPQSVPDEGADENESLVWKVSGIVAYLPVSDIASKGSTNNNFTVRAVSPPVFSTSSISYSSELFLDESLIFGIDFNNTGAGEGNVSLALNSSLTSNLPTDIVVAANDSETFNVNITPDGCDDYSASLSMDYYDSAGRLLNSSSEGISFSVVAPDLTITSLTVPSLTDGSNAIIGALITNNGTYNVTGFTSRLYYNTNISVQNITYNGTLVPGQNLTVNFNWDAVYGASSLKATVETAADECSNSNNEKSDSISVTQASSGGGSGGGGGGGGSSGGGSSGGSSGGGVIINTSSSSGGSSSSPSTQEVIVNTSSAINTEGEEEENVSGNLITGFAVSSEFKLRNFIDFPALLAAFLVVVLVVGSVSIYRTTPGSYEVQSVKVLQDHHVRDQFAYVPSHYLNHAVNVIDNLHKYGRSRRMVLRDFESKDYPPLVVDLAERAFRSTKVVSKNEAQIKQEILAFGNSEDKVYDYVSYTALVKIIKNVAELYCVVKFEPDMKRKIKILLSDMRNSKN